MILSQITRAELSPKEKEAFRTIADIQCGGLHCAACPLNVFVSEQPICIRKIIRASYTFIDEVDGAIGGFSNDY